MTSPALPLSAPRPLESSDDVLQFSCGSEELDAWLRDFGWVNHQSGNARIFVACRGSAVVGYYALATAGVEKSEAPSEVIKGGVPRQVPCLLLARLAVTEAEQGRRVGAGLLKDAIARSVRVSEEIGVRALLIHAKDDAARQFYLHHGEFHPSPSDPLHLFLNIRHARKLLADG